MCATGAKLAECVWGREMFEAKVAGATATHFEFSTFLHKFFFGGGGGGCSVFLYEWKKQALSFVCLLHRPSLDGIRVGRDSSVDVATSYGLDGPGIESQWGPDFQHTSIPTVGLTKLLQSGCPVSIPEAKRTERGFDYPPSSNAAVKETVVLYLYFSYGSSWVVNTVFLYSSPKGASFSWADVCQISRSVDPHKVL